MIVERKQNWVFRLFHVQGSSFEETWPRITTATLIAVAVTYARRHYDFDAYTLTTTPFTLIGVALAIFLGFRNNAAYDRFWEGRKLWGSLVNTSRSLTRQIHTLVFDPDGSDAITDYRRRFVKRNIAFVHALRHHLRGTDSTEDVALFLSAEDVALLTKAAHRPLIILHQMGLDLAKARDRGWIHELNVPSMDDQLVELSNILGACERIKNTPIPYTYSILVHRIVASYCLLLPFGIFDSVGVATPFVVLLISHAFFGLDAIGDEIEDPFGTDPNDLPLAMISQNIENNLLDLIGEPRRPATVVREGDIIL